MYSYEGTRKELAAGGQRIKHSISPGSWEGLFVVVINQRYFSQRWTNGQGIIDKK